MHVLALLLLLALLAILGLAVTLAFSRACFYASLLDEFDGSATLAGPRAPRTGAGRPSVVHGRESLRAAARPRDEARACGTSLA